MIVWIGGFALFVFGLMTGSVGAIVIGGVLYVLGLSWCMSS